MKALAIIATGIAVTLTSCTVSWSLGPDGSEHFNATIIPIPVDQDSKK